MLNCLISQGIINHSGELNKDKINLIAGAVTKPFGEMVWLSTGGEVETINRLTKIFVSLNTPTDQGRLFEIVLMLHGLLGLKLSNDVLPIAENPKALRYFLFSFICDFGEIMNDYLTETAQQRRKIP